MLSVARGIPSLMPARLPSPVPASVLISRRTGELAAPRKSTQHGLESVDPSLLPYRWGFREVCAPHLFLEAPTGWSSSS